MNTLILLGGKTFNIDYYEGNDFKIKDIATALSNQCRWGGHTLTWFSVAEHCVRVAWAVGDKSNCVKAALLHDASEYIYPDLPSPLARKVKDYKAETVKLQKVIDDYYGVDSNQDVIKKCDLEIREWEWRHYVQYNNEGWSPKKAAEIFLMMATSLGIKT